MMRDGFMAITMTSMIEVKGVGARYAGSATGFLMAWGGLGNVIAPPLEQPGNIQPQCTLLSGQAWQRQDFVCICF